jgi:hypothetical protein
MGVTRAEWRTSSYSSANGGACIEVAADWRTSSYSTGNGGQCVEVARDPDAAVAVRDSKDRQGPVLMFTPDEWRSFTAAVKAGEFDPA